MMNCEDIIFQVNNAINTAVKMQDASFGVDFSEFILQTLYQWQKYIDKCQ